MHAPLDGLYKGRIRFSYFRGVNFLLGGSEPPPRGVKFLLGGQTPPP